MIPYSNPTVKVEIQDLARNGKFTIRVSYKSDGVEHGSWRNISREELQQLYTQIEDKLYDKP